jgi:hypothetical protein
VTELSGGIIGIVTYDWGPEDDRRRAAAVRSGIDLAVCTAWPIWHGRIYAGPLAAFEVIWLEGNYGDRIQREIRMALAAGARAGYRIDLRGRFFLRLDITGAAAIVRQRVAAKSQAEVPIFTIPAAYTVLSLGTGVLF